MNQSAIHHLVLRIETRRRPAGEELLHSPLLKPDNLKRVINQVIEEINPTGNIQVNSLLLDLGTISLAQFETQFNPRLAQALTENLRRLSAESRPQPGSAPDAEPAALLAQHRAKSGSAPAAEPEALLAQHRAKPGSAPAAEPEALLAQHRAKPGSAPAAEPSTLLAQRQAKSGSAPAAEPSAQLAQRRAKTGTAPDAEPEALYPLAMLCLQPAALRQLMEEQRPEQLLYLLKALLIPRETDRDPASHYAYSRVTVSRLAMAALDFLLTAGEGHHWLRDNSPSASQLESWQDAIASGEIAVEHILDLLTGNNQLNASITARWLRPLWQRKAVRSVVHRRAGREAVQKLDARLNQMPHPQRNTGNGKQGLDMPTSEVSNAGLALLWPLLPQLFAYLELFREGQFIGENPRWQAVQSLHYLVWGTDYPTAESFPLNQLLCGIDPDVVMPDIIPLNEQRQQQIDAWLTAVGYQLPAWQKLALSDMRALFLQRPGEVVYDTEPPQIIVRKEAFDYLLADLPWPLTLVSLPWLEQPLTLIWPLPHLTG